MRLSPSSRPPHLPAALQGRPGGSAPPGALRPGCLCTQYRDGGRTAAARARPASRLLPVARGGCRPTPVAGKGGSCYQSPGMGAHARKCRPPAGALGGRTLGRRPREPAAELPGAREEPSAWGAISPYPALLFCRCCARHASAACTPSHPSCWAWARLTRRCGAGGGRARWPACWPPRSACPPRRRSAAHSVHGARRTRAYTRTQSYTHTSRTRLQIEDTMLDLRDAGVQILTLGQYLQAGGAAQGRGCANAGRSCRRSCRGLGQQPRALLDPAPRIKRSPRPTTCLSRRW